MQRTNNRSVESHNISVEVAKCGKYSQIHPVPGVPVLKVSDPNPKKWVGG